MASRDQGYTWADAVVLLFNLLFIYVFCGSLIGLAFCQPCQSCTNGECTVASVVNTVNGNRVTYNGLIRFTHGYNTRILNLAPVLKRCRIGDTDCMSNVPLVNDTGNCFVKTGPLGDDPKLYRNTLYDDRSYYYQCPTFTHTLIGASIIMVLLCLVPLCTNPPAANRPSERTPIV